MIEKAVISAESLGELLLNASKSNAKVCIPDIESANKIAAKLSKDIERDIRALRQQWAIEDENRRLSFKDMNTPIFNKGNKIHDH